MQHFRDENPGAEQFVLISYLGSLANVVQRSKGHFPLLRCL